MSTIAIPRPPRSTRNALPVFAACFVAGCACSFFQPEAADGSSGISNGAFPLQSGHWSHESSASGEATVSFDLSGDGEITDFHMTASFGTPRDTCTYTIDRTRIDIKTNGDFEISYSMDYADVSQQVGPAVMELFGSSIPEDEPYEVLRISGKAADTTMDGTYTIHLCGSALYFANNTGPWKAEWAHT